MSGLAIKYDDREKKELARKYLRECGDAISNFLDAAIMNKGMPDDAALEASEDIRRAIEGR